MSGVSLINEGTLKARKSHTCFDCGRTIEKGTVYMFQTCAYDGRVYTLHSHSDCVEASKFYRNYNNLTPYDFDAGIPGLRNIIDDAGEHIYDYELLRGYFPHVVCRMELTDSLRENKKIKKHVDKSIRKP